MDTKDKYITVNGINLHYRDWGGQGEVMLFLAGMGCAAYIFDNIAPQFTDSHKVFGLTRRGHGKSDSPDSGYDVDTLSEDIIQFLSAMEIDRVILIGHSMADIELTTVASKHPEKISKLIYLDAFLDRSNLAKVFENDPLENIEREAIDFEKITSAKEYIRLFKKADFQLRDLWNDVWENQTLEILKVNEDGYMRFPGSESSSSQIMETLKSFKADYSKVKCPALSFFTYPSIESRLPENADHVLRNAMKKYIEEKIIPWKKENIARFKKEIQNGKVVELENTSHYCFMDKEEIVVKEMTAFISG